MTLRNGLFFENNTTDQHAQDVRLMLKALLGGVTGSVHGVVQPDHLKVTEKAGTPDMSVDVAAGHAFIEGSRNSAQGVYHVYNDNTINVPLSASDPTNPRIDLIYVRARDSQYDAAFTGQDDVELLVAEGTPAAVPDPPTITDEDYLLLASVTVGANVSAVEDGDITDERVVVHSQLRTAQEVEGFQPDTSGSTTTSYAGFAGMSPEVTVDVPPSGKVVVTIGCQMVNNGANFTWMSFSASGANTLAGDDSRSIVHHGTNDGSFERSFMLTGLTPGPTTFREAVKVTAGSGSWRRRRIRVRTVP